MTSSHCGLIALPGCTSISIEVHHSEFQPLGDLGLHGANQSFPIPRK